MKKTIYLLCILLCFSTSNLLFAQNHYQKGWDYLNNADVDNAINSFEKALKDKATKEKAELTLTLLYSAIGKSERASELFNDFYDNTPDPGDELFALWFEEGVAGTHKKSAPYQHKLLKKIESDQRIKAKFEEIIKYRLLNQAMFSFNSASFIDYETKMNSVKNWAVVGPFDNVMNSGYNKDFGVLRDPEMQKSFQSKYGSMVQWFAPPSTYSTGYFFKDYNFFSNNSIVYAQSFIESPQEQDVIMKLGYSGSLKVWLNDSLAYGEGERRACDIDYFQVKCHLNKGFNRVLVQLGDYEEANPTLLLRFTDLSQKALNLPTSVKFQPYQKDKSGFTPLTFFAVDGLQKKVKAHPNEILYKLLLARTYLRANELYAVEEILAPLYTAYPKNYLVIRAMSNFYYSSGNNTEYTKLSGIYKDLFPEDFDVLANDIKEATDQKDKAKVSEKVNLMKSKFPHAEYVNMMADLIVVSLDENVDKIISTMDEIAKKYPDDDKAIIGQYQIKKSMNSNPKESNAILENYLKTNYNYTIAESLASDYIDQGRIDDAISLIERSKLVVKDPLLDRKIINLLTRKREYDGAIKICQRILDNRPSDYETLGDIAFLHKLKGDKKKAISYYEEALRYFPFSFDYNEKIRELKGQKPVFDLATGISPVDMISNYEKNFVAKNKQPYDIVADMKSLVVFKTKATGFRMSYIIKINQESAIEKWQKMGLGAEANMSIQINETKTIKKNGNKIEAERGDGEAVFTNLEVGDYIYVDYIQKQIDGSKSALFIYDNFTLNSYSPVFKREYTVFTEEGVSLKDTIINGDLKPEIKKVDGFNVRSWKLTSPEIVKDESYSLPFSDIGTSVHINLGYTWNDIAQWYSDLSEKQAQPDFTIRSIAKNLFEGKNYSDEQKAKVIYDFVTKNIQYSSIDFRQGSYIPQKASTVYHTRLGDCKDVSTLYASIARAAGLDVNLVLINTRNNGQKNVVLPSLNFNHCIVKVNLKTGSRYLELTDTDLPYGHLYYSHNGASILEIPNGNIPENIKLNTLKLNEGFFNTVIRNGSIQVNANNSINAKIKAIKTGNQAGNTSSTYYYSDDDKRKEDMKKELAGNFTSTFKLITLVFDKLEPRSDTSSYTYEYTVENEIKKVGSFKTLKIPFSDLIAKLDIFDDTERVFDFDYNYYETVDFYEEVFTINLSSPLKFLEIPENVHVTFKGNTYDLSFKKTDEQHLKVKRSYQAERKNISAKDFEEFKTFITRVVEAENTSLVLK